MKRLKIALSLLLIGTLFSFAAKAQEYIKFKPDVHINVSNGVDATERGQLGDYNNVIDPAVTTNPCSGSQQEACAWQIQVVSGGCALSAKTVTEKMAGINAFLIANPTFLSSNTSACGASFTFTAGTLPTCTYTATLLCRPV